MTCANQIRAVDAELRSDPDFNNLIAPLISGAVHVTSTNLLPNAWVDVKKGHMTTLLVSGWGLLSRWVPLTDEVIAPHQLEELNMAINDLESAANSAEIPTALRAFALEQVAVLRQALARYRISGIEPLRKALATAVGEVRRDEENLRESVSAAPEKASKVVRAFSRVWTIGAQISEDFEKYQKGFGIAYQLAGKAHDAWSFFQHLLPGPNS